MNFLLPVRQASHRYTERPAIVDGELTLSYAELWSAVSRTAALFRESGLTPGERVAVWLPNGARFLIAHFGLLAAGCVSVPMKEECGPVELEQMLSDSRPSALIAESRLLDKLTHDLPAATALIDPERISVSGDPCDIGPLVVPGEHPASVNYSYYFGEGRPYGAVLTHANYATAAVGYAKFHGMRAPDRTLIVLPMPHVFTLAGAVLSSLYRGAAVVVGRAVRPRRMLEEIVRQGITQLPAVPQLFDALARFHDPGKYDLSSLHHLVSGADFLPAVAHRRIQEKLGVTLVQGYGLTECFPVLCNPPDERNRPGTLGVSGFDRLRYRITDPDGRELERGATGEIEIQSPTVMAGYFEAPDATARVLRGGWLRTGDLGSIDEAGHLCFHAMQKQILNVYGNNVDPSELERVVGELAGVVSVSVGALSATAADEIPATRLCADVKLEPGAELAEKDVRAHCRSRLAPFKVPGEVRFS